MADMGCLQLHIRCVIWKMLGTLDLFVWSDNGQLKELYQWIKFCYKGEYCETFTVQSSSGW